MSDERDKVIDLETARRNFEGKETTLRTRRTERYCLHPAVLVYEDCYRVECAECEEPLDPYNVLLQYARKERNFQWTREEQRKLDAEIADLKREEKRVKARLERARQRLKETEAQA